ncbi:MAG TPA: acyl-CoA thioesterase domain-containing protein, partial [Steroidobacteraceae bacterium]|nr:acyl-CoA thioesterase domain-containing protein [Steroidobacteraceae bacterium]
MATDFSRVLASITTAPDGRLQVVVPPDWLQGRTVFGGMQMALAVRGMRTAMPDETRALPLRSVQMTFVGPVGGGEPVFLSPQLLRRGRSTSHARCDLLQGDGVGASAVGIFGVSRTSQFVHELPAPDPGKRPEEV